MDTNEPEEKYWEELSLAGKTQRVAYIALMTPYIVGKVLWDGFDHNNSKTTAIPKISLGYDPKIIPGSEGAFFLRYYVNVEIACERRLFGIKREEFSNGVRGKGGSIEINSSPYLEEKILEEHAPQIARVTYGAMLKHDSVGRVKRYTLLESPPNCGRELKPFPATVLSAINKNLVDIMLW